MRRLMAMLVVVSLGMALFAPAAVAEDEEGGHAAIVWVGTVATNLFYMPVKIVHVGLGGLVGGLAWLVSGGNPNVANGVFDHSVFGSLYVTPEMLEGKEPLNFFGEDNAA